MPYKFFTIKTLANELGLDVNKLILSIKTGKIKALIMKEQVMIRQNEFEKHRTKSPM